MKTSRNVLLLLVVLAVGCSMWLVNSSSSEEIEERILQATTYTTTSTRLGITEKACVGKNRSSMVS